MSPENKVARETDGELEQLRARLQDLEARFQMEKMEAVGRLSGGVSHDLNNYLTPILAYGNMVLEDLPPDSPLRDYMVEVVKAGDRALATTKMMQSLRLKTTGLVPMDINSAVQSQLDHTRAELGANVSLVAAWADDAGLVMGEAGGIEKIVEELVRNAKQAMPAGGAVTVRTRRVEEPGGQFVELTVKDEGTGMTPEVRERMFDPYFSTRPKGQGKGLGLTFAYAAICRAGGFLRCRSELGAGTEFRVFFRAAPP